MADSKLVVVGVDGSDGADDALVWALREALRVGAPVQMLATWSWLDQPPTQFEASHGAPEASGFRGLLLGSVSQPCVHHAHCLVVVVRERVAA